MYASPTDAQVHCYPDSDARSYSYSNCKAHSHARPNPKSHAYVRSYFYAYRCTGRDPHFNVYVNTGLYSDLGVYACANTDIAAATFTKSVSYTFADRYSDASADAHPGPDAYAHANVNSAAFGHASSDTNLHSEIPSLRRRLYIHSLADEHRQYRLHSPSWLAVPDSAYLAHQPHVFLPDQP